jgi:hypothetical protein
MSFFILKTLARFMLKVKGRGRSEGILTPGEYIVCNCHEKAEIIHVSVYRLGLGQAD